MTCTIRVMKRLIGGVVVLGLAVTLVSLLGGLGVSPGGGHGLITVAWASSADGGHGAGAAHDGGAAGGQAGDHGGGEHKGGLPQLNPAYFPTQIFWLAIFFSILYFINAGAALPRVAEVIETRDSRIAHDIDRADEMRNETAELTLEIDKRLNEARKQAHSAIALVVAEVEASRARALGEIEGEVERRLATAEERISRARQKALKDVNSAATELAGDVVLTLAAAQIDASAVARVVGETVREGA